MPAAMPAGACSHLLSPGVRSRWGWSVYAALGDDRDEGKLTNDSIGCTELLAWIFEPVTGPRLWAIGYESWLWLSSHCWR